MTWRPWLLVLVTFSLVYAALVSLSQKEVLQVLALVLISQNGTLLLGLTAWNELALNGVLLLTLAQGISGAVLLGLAGEIVRRTGENRLEKLGGLAQVAPRLSQLFLLGTFVALGAPGFANFAGLWLVFSGTAVTFQPLLVLVPLLGILLQAVGLLRVVRLVLYGKLPDEWSGGASRIRDLTTLAEWGPYVLLLGVSLALGLAPWLVTRFTEPSITLLPYVK